MNQLLQQIDPVHLIAAFSGAGALIFFFVGYLSRSIKNDPAHAQLEQALADAQYLGATMKEKVAENQALKEKCDAVSAKFKDSFDEIGEMKNEMESLRSIRNEANARREAFEKEKDELGEELEKSAEQNKKIEEKTRHLEKRLLAKDEEIRKKEKVLNEKIGTLEDRLKTAQPKPIKPQKPTALKKRSVAEKKTMTEALEDLMAINNVNAAFIAEKNGTMITGAGEKDQHGTLSTVAGKLAEVGLKDIKLAHVKGEDDKIIACRFFKAKGEDLILGTIGTITPPGAAALELAAEDIIEG